MPLLICNHRSINLILEISFWFFPLIQVHRGISTLFWCFCDAFILCLFLLLNYNNLLSITHSIIKNFSKQGMFTIFKDLIKLLFYYESVIRYNLSGSEEKVWILTQTIYHSIHSMEKSMRLLWSTSSKGRRRKIKYCKKDYEIKRFLLSKWS